MYDWLCSTCATRGACVVLQQDPNTQSLWLVVKVDKPITKIVLVLAANCRPQRSLLINPNDPEGFIPLERRVFERA